MKQPFRLGDAGSKRRRIDESAGVVREIALVAQGIEHRHPFRRESDGLGQ